MHTPAEPSPALRLLYADAQLLVFDKPSGLLSVPGRGEHKQDCLSARAQRLYPDALVVHRLDMATSGLLLMARGKASQSTLGKAFANGAVHKRYEALVQGQPQGDAQTTDPADAPDGWNRIDLPILLDWPRRPLSIISPQGKPSQTRWRLLQTQTDCSRVALEPLTGRSHQLRVHLLAIGHPILGDALYTPGHASTASRLMLHATDLRFPHPATGEALHFHSTSDF